VVAAALILERSETSVSRSLGPAPLAGDWGRRRGRCRRRNRSSAALPGWASGIAITWDAGIRWPACC
jgi:hypothetical protein